MATKKQGVAKRKPQAQQAASETAQQKRESEERIVKIRRSTCPAYAFSSRGRCKGW